MEKEVHVTRETDNGMVIIRFELENPMMYCLSFSSGGLAVLEIPYSYADEMRQFGLHLLFADELKVDLTQLEINFASSTSELLETDTMPGIMRSVRQLCLCANLYFKERAAFYWGILSSQCRVTNMQVLSHRYKIAYKQLIEIDSVLFNNAEAQRYSKWEC